MNRRQLIPWRRTGMPARMIEESPFEMLWQDMNRTMENFLSDSGEQPFGSTFSPSLNMTENDTAYTVAVEVPGVAEDDIEITLTPDILTIKGEKKEEQEEKTDQYYHLERKYGSFCRQVPLPPNTVNQDEVVANFDKGILTITLPKLEEAQQIMKRIPIKVD